MIINIENNYNQPISILSNNIFSPISSGKIVFVNTGTSGSGIVINSGVSIGDYDYIQQFNISGTCTGLVFQKYFNYVFDGGNNASNFHIDASKLVSIGLNAQTLNDNGFGVIALNDCGIFNNEINFPELTGSRYSAFSFYTNSSNNFPDPISINFPKLKETSNMVFFATPLISLNYNSLEYVGSLVFQRSPGLTSLDFPNLKSFISLYIDIFTNTITGINMPNLTGWAIDEEFSYTNLAIEINSPLTSSAVDSLLYTILQTSPTQGSIALVGACEPPSELGITYVTALQNAGVSVSVNWADS